MFFLKRRRTNAKAVDQEIAGCAAVRMRHYEIASESMELLQKTLNPKLFSEDAMILRSPRCA